MQWQWLIECVAYEISCAGHFHHPIQQSLKYGLHKNNRAIVLIGSCCGCVGTWSEKRSPQAILMCLEAQRRLDRLDQLRPRGHKA